MAAIASPAEATIFEINSLAPTNDAVCDSSCTLRDAVEAADLNGSGSDSIRFQAGLSGEITLTDRVEVDSEMIINGPGRGVITVSGDSNGNDVHDGPDVQIFDLEVEDVGNVGDPVTISGLTLAEGDSAGQGAAIRSYYTDLTVDDVVFTGNRADIGGGAIYSDSRPLTVVNSTFAGNATDLEGGAIKVAADQSGAGSFSTRDSIFTGNRASYGGAIAVGNIGTALITGSTFEANHAEGVKAFGGAIFFQGPTEASARLESSTITGGTARFGAGLYISDAPVDRGLNVLNSTIAGNQASVDGGGVYQYNVASTQTTTLASTIVAGNSAIGAGPDLDGNGSFIASFSLIQDGGATVSLNQVPPGSNVFAADPQLAPLADNGGPTLTMLPAPTSPAVDAGVANALTADQRGFARTVQQPGANAVGSDGTDIGAAELADGGLEGSAVSAKRKQRVKGKKVKVVVKASAEESFDASASGVVKAGKKKYPLGDGTVADAAAGSTAALTLKPKSRKGSKRIAKFLSSGKKAKATINVEIADQAGNASTDRLKVTLSGKRRKR